MSRTSFKYGRTSKERKIRMAYTKKPFYLCSVQWRDTLLPLNKSALRRLKIVWITRQQVTELPDSFLFVRDFRPRVISRIQVTENSRGYFLKLVPSPKYPTFFLYEMGNYSEVFQLLLILYTFLCCLIFFFKKLFKDFSRLFIKFNAWWHTLYLRHYFFFHIWISF